MLSEEVFQEEFVDKLCPRFRIPIENPAVVSGYYESFQDLSDETFRIVSKLAFREDYLPSPKWFYEQQYYLAEKARRENPIVTALQSSIDRELSGMSEDDFRRGAKIIRDMLSEIGKQKNGSGLLDRNREPIEPFRLWLEAQEHPEMLRDYSRQMATIFMARSRHYQIEYLQAKNAIESLQEVEF